MDTTYGLVEGGCLGVRSMGSIDEMVYRREQSRVTLLRLGAARFTTVQRLPAPLHYLLVQLPRASEQSFNLGVPPALEHGRERPFRYALRRGYRCRNICGRVHQSLREMMHAGVQCMLATELCICRDLTDSARCRCVLCVGMSK